MTWPTIYVAHCPEHGLHGQRTSCFECSGRVDRVPLVHRDALIELEAIKQELGGWAALGNEMAHEVLAAGREAAAMVPARLHSDHQPGPAHPVPVAAPADAADRSARESG